MTEITTAKLPNWDDFPDLEIYMDQLVNLGNRYLADLTTNLITPAMVNSYVKKGLISRPVKKKYQQQHLAELLMISLFKTVYSLDVVNQLLLLIFDENNAQAAYEQFAALFNAELALIITRQSSDKILPAENKLTKVERFSIRAVIYQLLGQQEIQKQVETH
ncbi:hypothetical protein LPAF129_05140 [Ligilactobacillus pabuli]|uniref:DUF1836 domain-containing protein n=1 Tax=Ligilactobacillus pabuli TaxID=2886039 RepID=A0ABQ5JFK1_9LACO|nr:DUF1836 domain-containing protein [Ligilactobacillus pabuli]GKS80829.1 hypothetical protein LPAF129_05140 [Ligilactobacillus pabuli]